jgi:hypothetical protein
MWICEHYNHDICIRLRYVNTIIMISVKCWDKWTLQLWYLHKAGICEHYNHDICIGRCSHIHALYSYHDYSVQISEPYTDIIIIVFTYSSLIQISTLQSWYLYKIGICEHYNNDICIVLGKVNSTIMISV